MIFGTGHIADMRMYFVYTYTMSRAHALSTVDDFLGQDYENLLYYTCKNAFAWNADISAHAQKRYRHILVYTHRERLVCNHEPRAKALGNEYLSTLI